MYIMYNFYYFTNLIGNDQNNMERHKIFNYILIIKVIYIEIHRTVYNINVMKICIRNKSFTKKCFARILIYILIKYNLLKCYNNV